MVIIVACVRPSVRPSAVRFKAQIIEEHHIVSFFSKLASAYKIKLLTLPCFAQLLYG